MIRGVLVEKHKSYAIVLTKNGDFKKTEPVPEKEIGEEATVIPLEEFQPTQSLGKSLFQRLPLRVGAIFVLILLFSITFYAWVGPSNDSYAYVSIDINPSIELTLDDSYQVVNAIGRNDEGSSLLDQLNWKEEAVVEITESIIQKSDELGYMDEDHEVLLGISYTEQEEDTDLLNQISEKIHLYDENMSVATFEIPHTIRNQAQEFQQSMNMTYATEKLTEYYETLESDDALNEQADSKTVQEETDSGNANRLKEETDRSSIDQQAQKIEILKRFIERSNAQSLPPGLLKKIKEDQILPPGHQKKQEESQREDTEQDESSDREDEPSNKGEDHPSNNRGNGPPDKGEDHPSNNRGNDPPDKGEGHPSNNRGNGPPDKGEDHPSNNRGNSPPDKGEDHPSNNRGNGPPDKGEDHPSNNRGNGPPDKGEDHPSNNRGNGPPDKGEDHPSNNRGNGPPDKGEGHPSNNRGNGPPDKDS